MTLKKILKTTGIIIITVIFLIWLIPFLHNEVLTLLHGNEFRDEYKQVSYFSDDEKVEYYKVIEYSPDKAKVYYISQGNETGNVYTFVKDTDGKWNAESFDTIWSATGSASETLWPYFWYIIYGGI